MKRPYLVLFFVILLLNFLLPRLMPGGPFSFDETDGSTTVSTYTDEQIAKYKEYYRMDRPVVFQFIYYINQLAHGNLGYSIYQNKDVVDVILARLPWTLSIVAVSLVISAFLGVFFGTISAMMRSNKGDSILYFSLIVLGEIPSFLIGIVLLFGVAASLGWFPIAGGMTTFAKFDSVWEQVGDLVHHAILPIATLVISKISFFYIVTRNSVLTVLMKDYIRTAKGKGLQRKRIMVHYAIKNALPPILTRFFMSIGGMIGGAILVENVFKYPGIGKLMVDAIFARDYVLIQGIFLVLTIIILAFSALADFCYKKVDPRVVSE